MTPPMGTTTKQPTSNQGYLQFLRDKVCRELRLPTQIEISYANNLTRTVDKEAWKESHEVRYSMLGLAQDTQTMFGFRPFDMLLNGENEADGKEMVLRNNGKRSSFTAPAANASKRQRREPTRPLSHSGKINQNADALDQSGRVHHIAEVRAIQNAHNGAHGHNHSRSIENPSATSFLTNSAPVYNQNINSGSGQQNIQMYGVFEPPPPPATGAAPTEYKMPTEPEHRLNRDAGQQKFSINDTVTNKAAGDGKSGGHSQTFKGPHGNTHMRVTAPFYNQNVNTGSGQQNIDTIGKIGFERKDRKERPCQDHAVATGPKAIPQPQRRDNQAPRSPSYRPTSPQNRPTSPRYGPSAPRR